MQNDVMGRKKILVIDDEPISNRVVVTELKSHGYVADMVDSGNKAWELLNANPHAYSLIIVDRMMAGIDGMELVRRMKATPQLQNIPIIMQTGEAEPHEHIEALREGVMDFIYKPFNRELLLFLVNKALEE